MSVLKKIYRLIEKNIWEVDTSTLAPIKYFSVKLFRIIYVGIREFSGGEIMMRANSLVYTTLLSFAPFLAVTFSLLMAFGADKQLEVFLQGFLVTLGPKGEEITENIIGFVRNIRFGILGTIGFVLLIYNVVSMIEKIEDAFNNIWNVEKPRGFARKITDYLAMLVIGPVLIFLAIGITASLMSTTVVQIITRTEPFGTVFIIVGKLLPYFFICAAFSFMYYFIPNTKVHMKCAVVGGITGGILWESAGIGFTAFVVTSSKYSAIYSGFAILILFVLWIQISWLILLSGAKIAYYVQYPQVFNLKDKALLLGSRSKERLALMLMYHIGRNFCRNEPQWNLETLVKHLGIPLYPLQKVLITLRNKRLIVETDKKPPAFIPAKALETISLTEIVNAVRIPEEEPPISQHAFAESSAEIDAIMEGLDEAISGGLKNRTLKDLVVDSSEGHPCK
jgi:membrane protein